MQLCPVCGWEDAPGHHPYNGSNEISLVQGQRRFLTHGACEAHLHSTVREPLPAEARSSHWKSFDELREMIIKAIEKEFHNVSRDGGTTLHQMDLVDGGWPMTEKSMKDAASKDPELRWQDIPPGKLSLFSDSLCFLDDLGFRFYLPAFMRHALITASPDIDQTEIDGIIWSLDRGPDCDFRRDCYAWLTSDQKQATAAFVHLFATSGNDYQAPYAQKGRKRGWDQWTPEFVRLSTT